jgi:hypothetical protein
MGLISKFEIVVTLIHPSGAETTWTSAPLDVYPKQEIIESKIKLAGDNYRREKGLYYRPIRAHVNKFYVEVGDHGSSTIPTGGARIHSK